MSRKILCIAFIFFCFILFFSFFFILKKEVIIKPSYTKTEIDRMKIDKNKNEKLILKCGGSTSMSKLLNVLGEEFANQNPNFSLQKSETGSGAAIIEVLDGVYDLGDISRDLEPEEKNEDLIETILAFDGICVIVNEKNPVRDLKTEDIKNIFSGKIKKWSEIIDFDAQITTIGREESSGTREGFENVFFKDKNEIRANYEIELPESGDVISRVLSESGAIGYVSFSAISSGNVKDVSIDSIKCSLENIKNKIYKIVRPFIQIYLKKNSSNELIKRWFEFIFSPKGSKIIEEEKFVSTC